MSPLPRRRFLSGCGALAAGLGAAALGGCSAPGLPQIAVPATVADRSRTRRLVRFANWVDYIDTTAAGSHPTLAEFTRQTGIRVDYTQLFSDADQPIGLVAAPMAVGRQPGFDLIVAVDWVLAQFIEYGWAAELSAHTVSQAWRMLPPFRDWPVPGLTRYAMPWQAGFTGIGYNLSQTRRPVTSMTDLLTAPDLHGRVSLVSDMRDVMGLLLLEMGSDPASFTDAEFGAALAVLRRAVTAGQIALVSNYYYTPLAKGTIAAGVAWSGDILEGREVNPALHFCWPKGGGMLWTDNMMIPALAPARQDAERLMNFYYQPHNAAQLSAYTRYVCPVQDAQAAMRQIDPALAGQEYIFPTAAMLASSHNFKILDRARIARYTTAFQAAVGL